MGARITPTLTSTVIPARARKLGYFVLHRLPGEARPSTARLENYGWATITNAMEIQSAAADINGLANLLQVVAFAPSPNLFVDYADQDGGN